MFGGQLKRPSPPVSRKKLPLKQTDVFQPDSNAPGRYAHRARPPNSDYQVRLMQFKQRKAEYDEKAASAQVRDEQVRMIQTKYQRHWDNNVLRSKIQMKLRDKLADYEASVERRREKLKDLIAKDEREFVYETVDMLQKADDDRLTKMKKRSDDLKAAREAERQEIVHMKKIQQYGLRCQDMRPLLSKKQTMESKMCQLQQMRENQARKEAEKELDKMWCDMLQRQDDARYEREVNEAIKRYNGCREAMEVLCKQIQAKKMMENQRKQIELANKKELEERQKRMKQKEIEDKIMKRDRREQDADELRQQIEIQKRFRDQSLREERALDEAFRALNDLELRKERSKITDSRDQMKREIDTYKYHLEILKRRRKEDDAKFEKLIEEFSAETRRKAEETYCLQAAAKEKLKQEVLATREAQLKYKREKAMENLEMKQKETEMIRSILEMNRRLDIEAQRINKMATHQYRNDLNEQINYNDTLRRREIEETEARLRKSIEEEKMYENIVRHLLNTDQYTKQIGTHPFRTVLEQTQCCCPNEKL